ncbi:flippase [Coraliomargarita parva]|uniref:flippase n=1 Tax=Coraliomargarita parva TaxID=3014050 RepID=UPI0022B57A10|nr:flippase [Coraliomargarita parva]
MSADFLHLLLGIAARVPFLGNRLNKYIQKLDTHTLEVYRKSFVSLVLKVFGMVAMLIISIILGRTLGPEGLGIINLSNRIVGITLILCMLGLNTVVLKEVAIAFEAQDWQRVTDAIYTAKRIILPYSFVLSLCLIAATPWLSGVVFREPSLLWPVVIALSVVVFQVSSRISASAINGFRKVWQSNLVNETLSSYLVLLSLMLGLVFGKDIGVLEVALIYAVARVIVSFVVGIYWSKLFKVRLKPNFRGKSMMKVGLPLLLVSATSMIASNADTIMLGWLSSSSQVGFYSVAARLGFMTSILHMLTVSAVTPKIAALYGADKIKELELMVRRITLVLSSSGLFFVAFFVFGGSTLLQLWGAGFADAYPSLICIAIAQFFNVSTGPSGIILIMSGHERLVGLVSSGSMVLNLALNYILIPRFGAFGASLATASVLVIENIIKVILVYLRTGIVTVSFCRM